MKDEWAATRTKTPIGSLWLIAREDRLWGAELEPRFDALAARMSSTGIDLPPGRARDGKRPVLVQATRAIAQYFQGRTDTLRGVPLDLQGTPFQRAVWRCVRKIRPGRTITYGALAERVGMSGAFRAVGAANGANPIVLFVPCHRVVAGNGSLRGYGAGLPAKSWLLRHEGVENDGKRLRRR